MTRSNTLHRRCDQFVAKFLVSQTPAPPDLPIIGLCLLPPPLFHLQGKFSAIFAAGWASVLCRNDVINLEVRAPETLGEMAIFTAEERSFTRKLNEMLLHATLIRCALRLQRENGSGFHELNEPADTKIVQLRLTSYFTRRLSIRAKTVLCTLG